MKTSEKVNCELEENVGCIQCFQYFNLDPTSLEGGFYEEKCVSCKADFKYLEKDGTCIPDCTEGDVIYFNTE